MNIKLKCACGAVQGEALNITPDSGNRVVCCCDDCQAFANYLEQGAVVLDEFGGTDIYQTSQSQVKLKKGQDHLRCLRLSSKGLYRWYTGCCNTPIGTTLNGKLPFIGLTHSFTDLRGKRDSIMGPVRAYVQTQHAIGTPSYPHAAKAFPLGITLRIVRKMAHWKLKGMHQPSVFFNADGKPTVEVKICDQADRAG